MLHRITALGGLGGVSAQGDAGGTEDGRRPAAEALPPVQTLDGFGALRPPPPTAEAIPAGEIAELVPSLAHPPGYYGAPASPRSVNVLGAKSALSPLPPLPQGMERRAYLSRAATPLTPWLLAAALALVFLDIAAILWLLGGGFGGVRKGKAAEAAAAFVVVLAVAALSIAASPPAFAQASEPSPSTVPPSVADVVGSAIAQKATEKVTLGYVMTGNEQADQTSRLGLSGLSRVLAVRTAVEPAEPIGVDIINDEIAFFPVLYWPVLENAKALPEPTLAKIDAFMKQGGMIIFDTRDFGSGRPVGSPLGSKGGNALQRLLGSLDLPRLEPVPEEHVLTKSFYLLRTFPGRWDGGQLWVEAEAGDDNDDGSRKARRADGVTSVLVTSNDFASAWALDTSGRPLYPVVPGGENQREMALRTGINIVMHALTGNYKADQVHVPALLERLGQ
jgi:hypothetical protein